MKITVITVCRNSVSVIAHALESVALQTHTDIEHIVIDGGSTDGTLQLIKSAPHVALWTSEPDKGIYDAMNKGLRLASGEIVGFLNADDVFAKHDTLALIAEAAQSPVDIVYGDLVYVQAEDYRLIIRHWRSGAFSRSRLRYGWMPPHPTFYIRRSLLEGTGAFDPNLRIAGDYDFMLRCLLRPNITVAYIPQVLVRMRVGGISNGSLMNIWRKSREDIVALRNNRAGGIGTLICKVLRKLPQFLSR